MSTPDQTELIVQAAEYVIGTLSENEREVFERQLHRDSALRAIVSDWQARLQPLSDAVDPIEPPEWIWQDIRMRLGDKPGSVRHDSSIVQRPVRRNQSVQADNFLWRGVTSLAVAASLLMAVLMWQRPLPETGMSLQGQQVLGIVSNDQQQVLWLVDAAIETGTLRIVAITPPSIEASQSWQLWLVRPDNGGVTSLGLLPTGDNESIVLTGFGLVPETAAGLAVSLEPAGGSPRETPTGPVLYQADIRLLRNRNSI